MQARNINSRSFQQISFLPPRSLVTHKKLKEIATAQQTEMHALATQLDKMRMRTYPTFVEPTLGHLPPDTNASLWK